MSHRLFLIVWIIITLLLATLLVSEKIGNKRLSDEIKRLSDNLGIEPDWRRDWKPTDIDKLPDKPGVYVLWKEAKFIHIGESGNLKQRLSGHPKKPEMTSFDWYETGTKEEAERLEKNLHRMFRYKGR